MTLISTHKHSILVLVVILFFVVVLSFMLKPSVSERPAGMLYAGGAYGSTTLLTSTSSSSSTTTTLPYCTDSDGWHINSPGTCKDNCPTSDSNGKVVYDHCRSIHDTIEIWEYVCETVGSRKCCVAELDKCRDGYTTCQESKDGASCVDILKTTSSTTTTFGYSPYGGLSPPR